MKVVKHTNLVPVTLHYSGDVVGVPPAAIAELLNKDQGTLFPIPDGVETYDVPDPVLDPGKALVVEADVSHKVARKPTNKGGPQGKPKTAPKPEKAAKPGKGTDALGNPIEIPDDWRTMQWMKQVKLAGAIQQAPISAKGGDAKAMAIDIIEKEVARRAAEKDANSSGAPAKTE